eukprot:CAMPEP_0202699476 /NCGR_PEP_ID=MMETSP1385-20130828/12711_1 /ASSEMBLY_ACC=CAM_ASM_000861 /TAXON_ID=933848 /ORGANISM="Elphidium margaritaceum" /LENGTH=471 /DNA_ID=CAMNT_0049356437 /DNA_START=48 /DNA_END=1463 /DNA_ORIENTATION=-
MEEEKSLFVLSKAARDSAVRFVSTDVDPVDYCCERLFEAVQNCCGDKSIVPPLPAVADADPDAEVDELEPLFDAEDFPQPFINLVYDNASDIFRPGQQASVIEFAFNVTFSFLLIESNDDGNAYKADANIDKLSVLLSSQREEFSRLNLKLLCLLFNTLPAKHEKRPLVMQRLLDLGQTTKSAITQELFRGRLQCVQEWIENDWARPQYLTIEGKRNLFHSASAVAAKCGETALYENYVIQYLKLFDADRDETAINDAVLNEAALAVKAAISSDEFNTENVMELAQCDVIGKVLSQSAKHAALYKLLDILYQGELADFEAFYAQNGKLFTAAANDEDSAECLGLNHEILYRKMRLLTLCSFGSHAARDGQTYSFAKLMDALMAKTQNELEAIVIDAITEKLLFATIDYETETVNITRAKQRTFDRNSWKDLAQKLSFWRQNTNTVLQIVSNAGLNRWRQQIMQQMQKEKAK